MSDRKLATIRQISAIDPIPGADSIDVATVDGWKVVVKRGEFQVESRALYLEIDSWVPHHLAAFLSKGKEPREFNGVKGERLRTVKLRGQISQGLLLPLPVCLICEDGTDATKALGIQKWEAPVSAALAGLARGSFLSCVPKTDQERVQNIPEVLHDPDSTYQITVKLDGSSMTVAWIDGEMHVCSRNIDLKLDQDGNTFVTVAKKLFSEPRPWNIAIQGELMGPGIQGNREGLSQHEFFVFDIFDICAQRYLAPRQVEDFCETHCLNHVPVVGYESLSSLGLSEMWYLLEMADGPSLNHPVREGIVFKRTTGDRFSFKAISNNFLLRSGD